ncbi:MAG: nucleotidyl transferase AbiEii/AbiGii toxin family protein [Actinobacteria bacterium]|nr:nucleotidyl transferase AbiEii/AbiGii toxin family protein [Actinomycetota bacterium]
MITERTVNRLANAYRSGGARPLAYLEHAQEHFLKWMDAEELFADPMGTAFKGGSAIRKFHLGHEGRFSTDLDFAIKDKAVAAHVLSALSKGLEYGGVRFRLEGKPYEEGGENHARWSASVPDAPATGSTIVAKLDFSTHDMWLPYEMKARAAIQTIDAQTLGFEPVCPPLVDLRENLSEKLARFRRLPLARDVYDLNHLGPTVRGDLPLTRQLLLLKVWIDVNDQARGDRPFEGGDEYCRVTAAQLRDKDDIGALAKPVADWQRELQLLCDIYWRAIGTPTGVWENRVAACDVKDRWWHTREVEAFVKAHAP